MKAHEHSAQTEAALNADDAMAASLHGRSAPALQDVEHNQHTLNLEKIRLQSRLSSIAEQSDTRAKSIGTQTDKSRAKMGTIADDAENPNQAHGAAAVVDLARHSQEAVNYLNQGHKGKRDEVKEMIEKCTSMGETKHVKEALVDLHKSISKGEVATFHTFVRSLNTTFAQLARKGGAPRISAAEAAEAAPKPPQWQILQNLQPKELNLTDSIYEAKGGVRGALFGAISEASFLSVAQAPLIKRSVNKANGAIKKGTVCCVDHIVAGKRMITTFEQSVCVAFGPEMRSKRALPKAGWAEKIFGFEVYASGPAVFEATWTNYALMQAIVVIRGDITYCCLRTDRIPGDTYLAKRNNILRATVDDITALLKDGGFLARFTDGVSESGKCGLLIPSGFMTLVASSGARVLRWSLMADEADASRVRNGLRNLLDSFPEHRNAESGYADFARHLGVQL